MADPLGPGGSWAVVFEDDFPGPTIDTTKWDPYWYYDYDVPGTDPSLTDMNNVPTRSSNVSIVNGRLFLRLYDGNGTQELSGGLVRTTFDADRYQVQVGDFVEAKILLAGDTTEDVYNWPAFWTVGKSPWPTNGEHDILEGLGGVAKTVYHYKDANGVPQQKKTTPPGDWGGSGFHTYGLHRKTDSADIYWDGVKVFSYTTSDPDGPHEVILNVGKGSDTRTPRTNNANGMRVEYVRAWRPTV